MGFLGNLLGVAAFQQGNGQIKCKSGYTRTYWTAIAENQHQCVYCGKRIRPGQQLVTTFSSGWEIGTVYNDGMKIEKHAQNIFCSTECFRKGC